MQLLDDALEQQQVGGANLNWIINVGHKNLLPLCPCP